MTEHVSSTPVVARRRSASALNVMLGVALLVAVGGVAFAGGRLTSPAASGAAAAAGKTGQSGQGNQLRGPNASGAPGGGFARGGLGGNLALTGTVTASTPTSLTIALTGGQTVTVTTDSSTTYHHQAAGSVSDVTTGKQVVVQVNGRTFGAGGAAPGASPGASAAAGNANELKATSVTIVR
jgi:hypothetical protein